MFTKILATLGTAALATSIAVAEPPEGKGKPDKGGEGDPPGAIEVGFTWIDRKAGDLFGLSASNGTNYQFVKEGSQVSYFSLEDIGSASSGNRAILNDFGTLHLVDWTFNASGGVTGVGSSVIHQRGAEGGASCARFSHDGSKIYYTTIGTTLWSKPTADLQAAPTSEYVLADDERFVLCSPDVDGSVVAAIVTVGAEGQHESYRLSDFSLGLGGQEVPIVADDPGLIIVSVDVGPQGSLSYSYRAGGVYENETAYEVGGQTRILQNAASARYDCDEGRLLYQSRHPKNGARNWLIRDLDTGLTSDFPERSNTRRADWYC